MSATLDGRPSLAFVVAFFAALLIVSAALSYVVYLWRKRSLAAADLEALRAVREREAAKGQEERRGGELHEMVSVIADPPLKPLVLGSKYARMRACAYKSLALPRFLRNKGARKPATLPEPEIDQRPHWMSRPHWIKRSAVHYKRASASAIFFTFPKLWSAVVNVRPSSSCPGGFQKHQVRLNFMSTQSLRVFGLRRHNLYLFLRI